jgi:hypothetical protein
MTPTQGCTDYDEMVLQKAHDSLEQRSDANIAACRAACDRLMAQRGTPVTIRNCVAILTGAIDVDLQMTWQVRYNGIKSSIRTLLGLRWGSSGWTAFLDGYERLGIMFWMRCRGGMELWVYQIFFLDFRQL